MFQIVVYPILTVFILFFLGFGLTSLLIPSRLKNYSLWLSPWFAIIFIIFSYVIFGFLGLSVKSYAFFAIPFLMLLNVFVFLKKKQYFSLSIRDLIIFAFVIINIIFNLSPLIRRDKFMTALSLGNNDVITYSVASDYLVNHSLLENFATVATPSGVQHTAAADLMQGLYRWGEGIITAFFLNIFNLQAYQYIYIIQTILFALSVPLLYLILNLIYRHTFYGMILILLLMGFNANLLYILYHDFFGQILFWGLQLFILFFILAYFESDKDMKSKYNKYDLIIGVSLSALYFSYYEGTTLIIIPLVIYFIIKFLLRKNVFSYWQTLLKISLTAFLTSSYSFFTSIIQNYSWSFGGDHNQPIGWQLFRQKIPYANPYEAMSFYSIHSFEPLPYIAAILLSILVIIFILKGFLKSKMKLFLACFIVIYIALLFYTGIVDRNFFTYNRALTYSLFLFLVFFVIGFVEFLNNKKYIKIFIFFIMISLIMFSALKLNKRFIGERVSVDKSLVSIKEIYNEKIKEPIYMESYLDNDFPYWKQIWQFYFLYFNNPNFKPTLAIQSKRDISDNSLVLISKPTPWFRPAQVLLKNIVWENEYYKLGRLCNSDKCLMKRKEDLSAVNMGTSEYEDSLLISGWSAKEQTSTSRWGGGKESILRLFVKKESYTKLVIEALTLKAPQEISVYVDDKYIGKQNIKTDWQEYSFDLKNSLSYGVHNIKFIYSNTYRPVDLGINPDIRELSANFKKIMIE